MSSSFSLRDVLRPPYKPRRVRHKGAILTLVWNFSGFFAYHLFVESTRAKHFDYSYNIGYGLVVIIYPISGWLADVYFGRYKVIKYSLRITWLASILYVIAITLVAEDVPGADVVLLITTTFGLLSVAAYQANAIQFGADQLIDASSSDISSYFSWLGWSLSLSFSVVTISQVCTCKSYTPVSSFLGPVILTLTLCSELLFNHWLIKESGNFNPLKLVSKVVCYAIKNKYPRSRSAFMYWDDRRFSRVEFAKTQYGGPFTSEQVEDVKTFFRIMVIILVGSFFVGLVFVVNTSFKLGVMQHYHDSQYVMDCSSSPAYLRDCFQRVFIMDTGPMLVLVFVPVLEFVLFPLLRKCLFDLKFSSKFVVGMFLQLAYHLSLLALEVAGHYVTREESPHRNVTCLLELDGYGDLTADVLSLDYRWIALASCLRDLALYCLFTSTAEFVCAQSPYSMKGILGGMIYSTLGLAILLHVAMQLPFKKYLQGGLGCGVWYYLAVSILTGVLIVLACVVSKWYSARRRRETTQSQQS